MLLKFLSLPFNLPFTNDGATHLSFNEKKFPRGFLSKTTLTIGKVRCVWLGNKDFAPSFKSFLANQEKDLHKYTLAQHAEILSQIAQAQGDVEKASNAFVHMRNTLYHIEDSKRTVRQQKQCAISQENLHQLTALEDELRNESLPPILTSESVTTYVSRVNEVLEKTTARLKVINIIPSPEVASKELSLVPPNNIKDAAPIEIPVKKLSPELKKIKTALRRTAKQHISQLEDNIKKFTNEHVQLLSTNAKSHFTSVYEGRLKIWNELLDSIVTCRNETKIKSFPQRIEMQVKIDEGIEETLFAIIDFREAVMEIPSSDFCMALLNSREVYLEKRLTDMVKCESLSSIEKFLQDVQLNIDGQSFLIKKLRQSPSLLNGNGKNLPIKPLEFTLIKSICSDIAQEGFSILNASNLSAHKISFMKLSLVKVKEMALSIHDFEAFIDRVQLPHEWKYFAKKSLDAIRALIIAGQYSNEAFFTQLREERDIFTSMGFTTIEQHFNAIISQLMAAQEPFTDISKHAFIPLSKLGVYVQNWETIVTKLSKQSAINRLKESERALQKAIARIRAKILASNGETKKTLQSLLKSAPTYKEKNQIKNSTHIEEYIQKTDNLIKNPLAH